MTRLFKNKKLIIIAIILLVAIIGGICTIMFLPNKKDNKNSNVSNVEEKDNNSEVNKEDEQVPEIKQEDIEKNEDEETAKTDSKNKNTATSKNNNSSSSNKTTSKKTNTTKDESTNKYDNAVSYDIVYEEEDRKPYKYGIEQFTKITYMIYKFADGTTEKVESDRETNYDVTTFNATANDMKAEAQSVINSNQSIYNEVFSLINNLRTNADMEPLTLDSNLTLAATIRAIEMMYAVSFDHTRPTKKPYYTVLDELNIAHDSVVVENIEMQYSNAQNLVNSMQPTTIEYKNVTTEKLKKIGIGMFKKNNEIYWVQILTK